jgi:hypothetical protein
MSSHTLSLPAGEGGVAQFPYEGWPKVPAQNIVVSLYAWVGLGPLLLWSLEPPSQYMEVAPGGPIWAATRVPRLHIGGRTVARSFRLEEAPVSS